MAQRHFPCCTKFSAIDPLDGIACVTQFHRLFLQRPKRRQEGQQRTSDATMGTVRSEVQEISFNR